MCKPASRPLGRQVSKNGGHDGRKEVERFKLAGLYFRRLIYTDEKLHGSTC